MKKISNGKLTGISILLGSILAGLSAFAGKSCVLAEPGGMTNGWRGLPIPYWWCGVWGDSCHAISQCVQGMSEPLSSCLLDSLINLLIFIVDLAFWSGLSFFVLKYFWVKSSKKA